jgi:hypothetical protein
MNSMTIELKNLNKWYNMTPFSAYQFTWSTISKVVESRLACHHNIEVNLIAFIVMHCQTEYCFNIGLVLL